MHPLVTISIPIFQCEKHIIHCLQSVANQTYKNIEVLLIDDGGTDQSLFLVRAFLKKTRFYTSKIIENTQNEGLSEVRNKSILLANGKYIFFLDSDDELLPHTIEKMVTIAEKEQVQMVCGNVNTYEKDTLRPVSAFPVISRSYKQSSNESVFHDFVHGNFPVTSWNKLILLEFLKKNHLFFRKGIYAQDVLHSFETARLLTSVYFLSEPTYVYYLHQDSVIHNRHEKHINDWIFIAQEIEKHYHQEKDAFRKKKILAYLIDFKSLTLLMNWKAQKNKKLWIHSCTAYQKMAKLSLIHYGDTAFSWSTKKKNLWQNLPAGLAFYIFKKKFG